MPTITRFSQPNNIWDGFAIPDWSRVRFVDCLPTLPLWPGFAINTIFYAAIVWALFFAPFKLRRWRMVRQRIKRGLCPACAYPIGTSDVCTECGNKVHLARRMVC